MNTRKCTKKTKLYEYLEACLREGHPAGQISETFGIAEYNDGTIHEVEPTQIRFVDNAMSEYAFPEMEE